jgi:GDP-D-mannose dehydratase
MEDSPGLEAIIRSISPDEIYHLAALSQVALSWEKPELVLNVNGLGIIRILDAVRSCGLESKTRVLSVRACLSSFIGSPSAKFSIGGNVRNVWKS